VTLFSSLAGQKSRPPRKKEAKREKKKGKKKRKKKIRNSFLLD